MINKITGLMNKTDELEKYLDSFKKVQNRTLNKNTCLSFLKNLSNAEVILPKKILLAKVDGKANSRIFFQGLIELSLPAKETIELTISVNDIAISSEQKTLSDGFNQVVIMRNYEPLVDGELSVYLTIKPKNQRQLFISGVSLFVWGDFDAESLDDYQVIEINDAYLITLSADGSLYYKLTAKEKGEFSFSNLEFFAPSKSHAIAFDEQNSKTMLLRVDPRGNLFATDFFKFDEKFITSGVSKVSVAGNGCGEFLVSFIKNKSCYYFEMDIGKNFSLIKKLNTPYMVPASCTVIYNKFCGCYEISVSDKKQNNYLTRQVKESEGCADNISASYVIEVKKVE